MTRRVLDPADLLGALDAAQQALVAAPAGTAEEWVLPAGAHVLPGGVALGAAGRSLRLLGGGASASAGRTALSVGVGGPVAGDVVLLDLAGQDVAVDRVDLALAATGRATALRVRCSGRADVGDVEVTAVSGAAAVGVELEARVGALVSAAVGDVTATAGQGVGVQVTGGSWAVARLGVSGTAGVPLACALRARAHSLTVSALRVAGVDGDSARAVDLRTTDELTVLDARVDQVRAAAADAEGLRAASAGDVALRGVSVADVRGVRAVGALVIAGNEVDWLGGQVTDIRGAAAGAAGIRLLAAPSRAIVALADLGVRAVSAGVPGTQAAPGGSWRDWLDAVAPAVRAGLDLPEQPGPGTSRHVEDVVGIHVCAPVDQAQPWLDTADAGHLAITQSVLERISGTAVQVEADLRDVELRGLLVWTAARGGHLNGERVLVAQSTWHRLGTGLELGPCSLTAADTLVTGVDAGPGIVPTAETEVGEVHVVLSARGLPPFGSEPDPLPYGDPGPQGVPAVVVAGDPAPDAPHDLRLVDDALHRRAVRVPGDDEDAPVWVGALAPDAEARCELRDPAPPPPPPPPPTPEPGPVVDYRARDARALLSLMADRAREAMPGWSDTGPADETMMLLELVAERLDRMAYRQEVALSEGYLPTALERRSVEDHARLVDYAADPGLSATTMLRFRLDAAGALALGLDGRLAREGCVVIGTDTLVVNADARDRLVAFATEEDLELVPALDEVTLADEAGLEPGSSTDIRPGETSALVAGDLTRLAPGRWLVIVGVDPADPARVDPDVPAHVVRVTQVELGTDTTRVTWDPRRPAPTTYSRAGCRILGNVVPAHHGLPLSPLTSDGPLSGRRTAQVLEGEDLLAPWRERLTVTVDGAAGVREVPLPVDRVSVQARGWPFPGEDARSGVPQIRLAVDGEPWQRVDDLATATGSDDVFALRPGTGDAAAVVRVGDGVTGSALPGRVVAVDLAVRVGLGSVGNVGAGALTRVLALGPGGDRDAIVGEGGADRFALVRAHLAVDNPVPAIGGREPEGLERIRYRAPLGVRDALSAVVPADYERLLGQLPEVAAARATARDGAVAPVVQVTLLLRDEDALAAAGEAGASERLRRWATARARLERVRLLGFDVELAPPRFVPLDLDVTVDVAPWASAEAVEHGVREALAGQGGLFDPDVSGLGGDVHVDAIHQRVLAVAGVSAVRVHRLRRLEPGAPERVGTGVLPVSGHEVAVIRHPYGAAFASGLLTVDTCEGVA